MWAPPSIARARLNRDAWTARSHAYLLELALASSGAAREPSLPPPCTLSDESWRGEGARVSVADARRARWAPGLCGDWRMRECDARCADGLAAAAEAVRSGVPILMRGGAAVLAPVVSSMNSVEELSKKIDADELVHVMHAPPAARGQFTYFFGEHGGEGACAAPLNSHVRMGWADVVRQLKLPGRAGKGGEKGGGKGGGASRDGLFYLQLSLARRRFDSGEDRMETGVRSRAYLRGLEDAIGVDPMARLATPLGRWALSNLFVGPAGTLAPCHYDMHDNIFMQVRRWPICPPSASCPHKCRLTAHDFAMCLVQRDALLVGRHAAVVGAGSSDGVARSRDGVRLLVASYGRRRC